MKCCRLGRTGRRKTGLDGSCTNINTCVLNALGFSRPALDVQRRHLAVRKKITRICKVDVCFEDDVWGFSRR